MNFNANGFVVTGVAKKINNIFYCGIDCEVWPEKEKLEGFLTCELFQDFERVRDAWLMERPELIDYKLMQAYREYCKKINCSYRILYLETKTQRDSYDADLHQKYCNAAAFLGYDIGCCSGDFYSIVLNDIICRPNLIEGDFIGKLNKNGLFDFFEQALLFLRARCSRISIASSPSLFEVGEYQIIAVYDMDVKMSDIPL